MMAMLLLASVMMLIGGLMVIPAFEEAEASCEGFETLPQGGQPCNALEGDPSMGIPGRISCPRI